MNCFFIFIGSYLFERNKEEKPQDDVVTENHYKDNSDYIDNEMESEVDDNSEAEESNLKDSKTENVKELEENEILNINPIISSTYSADAVENLNIEVQPTNILEISGEITSIEQSNDYEFSPQVNGIYRFEFSNVPNGTDLRLGIYNSG